MRIIKLSVLLILVLTVFVMPSMLVFAADRLPSGPTYKEVLVATVQDAGKPFPLRTNIYLPKGPATVPTPLVLFIHGHGGAYNFSNGSRSYEFSIALSDRGIAVATIDYRHEIGLPENVYDVKAYVRWFRAKAKEYNIDPSRIGIWGTSRGGHLAAMLAASGDVKELEGDVGGNLDQSSRVQAAVIYYPFTDVFLYPDPSGALKLFYGAKDSETAGIIEAYKKKDTSSPYWKFVQKANLVNPMNYVSKDDPPVLITCGGNDKITPIIHSTKLFDKYLEMGAVASFYAYTPGVHGQVGADIEAATSEWIAHKLLVELASKK
jgi:acetyl esterase/lipase